MFRTRICCFICTFVAAALATGYSGQDSNTGFVSEVPVHHLRIRNPRSPALEDSGASPYATTQPDSNLSGLSDEQTPVPAQTITLTVDDYISLLRCQSASDKNRRLREAAEKGAVVELEALLEVGADVLAADELGWTALHLAAIRGHEEVVRRLLAAGAGTAVNTRDTSGVGRTPLHWAAFWGHAGVVRQLLAAGADHDARTPRDRRTALHWAVVRNYPEVAAALLEGGASRWARDSDGHTPLDIARQNKRQQLVELLQAGTEPWADMQPV